MSSAAVHRAWHQEPSRSVGAGAGGPSESRGCCGDLYVHVHYESADFNYETHRFAREIFDRLAAATRGSGAKMASADRFNSDLGTVALVSSAKSMAPLTYSCWVGATLSALVRFSPTLTMVALGIRTAEHILD
jgi:hypothetical protein